MAQDGVETAIVGLRHEVSLLVQGLGQMLATQEIQTNLLRTIVTAATVPSESEGDLAETLARIAGTLKGQAETLAAIRQGIEKLPIEVGAAVASHRSRGG